MARIGNLLIALVVALTVLTFRASADAALEVNPSSTEITEDENLRLDFKISIDSYNAEFGKPQYTAPDFDEVSAFSSFRNVETSFINGSISAKVVQVMTIVLTPKKLGQLKVSGIRVQANGKTITAPDLTIDVKAAGTVKRRSDPYSGNSQRSQLPGSGTQPSQRNTAVFFKTEPSKMKVYKGEQVMLTYSVYTQVPLLGIQVERYPNVAGFLKEDIDVPVLTNKLQFNRAVVGGREYNRAPLAQYAIFPLKEGKLPLDPMSGKVTYRSKRQLNVDDDMDPFGMLGQFMNSMQATTDNKTSDRLSIEVLPLPAAGQPASFNGLVGDFEFSVTADKPVLKVGESLNVKVKVEGKGHAGSLERLNVNWPQDFELYEDKSSTNYMKTGRSERVFDFMLIPKTKGKFEIPSIEVSMFNPESGKYQVRKSQPVPVEVLDGNLGSVYTPKSKVDAPQDKPKEDIRYWMPPSAEKSFQFLTIIGRVALVVTLIIAIISLIGLMGPRALNTQKLAAKNLKKLIQKAQELKRADQAPLDILAGAEDLIRELLSLKYEISVGSLKRAEVREALVEKKVNQEVAEKVESLLERCENFRFVPGGAQPEVARHVANDLNTLIEKLTH